MCVLWTLTSCSSKGEPLEPPPPPIYDGSSRRSAGQCCQSERWRFGQRLPYLFKSQLGLPFLLYPSNPLFNSTIRLSKLFYYCKHPVRQRPMRRARPVAPGRAADSPLPVQILVISLWKWKNNYEIYWDKKNQPWKLKLLSEFNWLFQLLQSKIPHARRWIVCERAHFPPVLLLNWLNSAARTPPPDRPSGASGSDSDHFLKTKKWQQLTSILVTVS